MSTPRAKVNDRFTEWDQPWVEPDGNIPFRYRVESKSNNDLWYVCDLTARNGHGRCSCVNFQMVAEPNFLRHQTWIPYAPGRTGTSECRHLRAAWDYFHLYTAVPMLAAMKDGIPSPP